MKKLLLLRHAKSDKHVYGMADFERPLNNRGKKAAALIGSFLGKKRIQPDVVISSPAERARQTATLATEAAEIKAELRFDERIYEATASQLMNLINQIEESAEIALLVGHNPGFEHLQSDLTRHVHHLPTAALVLLNLNIEKWSDANERCAALEWIITPKELEKE